MSLGLNPFGSSLVGGLQTITTGFWKDELLNVDTRICLVLIKLNGPECLTL